MRNLYVNILVFDIDETIYFKDDEKLTKRIFEKLKSLHSMGYEIYFATRREGFNLKEVNCYLEAGIVKDIICANGAYALFNNAEPKILSIESLNFDVNNKPVLITAKNGFYTNDLKEFELLANFMGMENIVQINELVNITTVKIRSELDPEIQGLESNQLQVDYNARYKTYEISPLDVNKESMVSEVLGNKKFIGFGDNPADDECLMNHAGFLIQNEKHHNDPNAITSKQMIKILDQLN